MALPNERTGIRAVQAADRVISDPQSGPLHVRRAIDSAVADYRRALARRLVDAGVDDELVWGVIAALPIEEGIRPEAPTAAWLEGGRSAWSADARRAVEVGIVALAVGLAAAAAMGAVYGTLAQSAGVPFPGWPVLVASMAALAVGFGVVWIFARLEMN